MLRNYCFDDIVSIDVIIDPVGKINNEKALEVFLYKSSLNEGTYIKILQLTFEAEPIFITIIYQDNTYKVQIDALNTSSPYKRKFAGDKLVVSKEAGRVSYDLYNGTNFVTNVFWYRERTA